MEFNEVLIDNKIKYVVYTESVQRNTFVCDLASSSITLFCCLDARSAVYYAIGISAQNKETVMVICNSNNESRNAFSGMTEAYYRNLPVVLLTLGDLLDYSMHLNDVCNFHCIVNKPEDLDRALRKKAPMHLEYYNSCVDFETIRCVQLQDIIAKILDNNDYLYISPFIKLQDSNFRCKVIHGGLEGCLDGALSNVLGATLANKRKRYIGIVSEKEFLHDMNALGNVNVNNKLTYIVICKNKSEIIHSYAGALNYEIKEIVLEQINVETLVQFLNVEKKKIIIIRG